MSIAEQRQEQQERRQSALALKAAVETRLGRPLGPGEWKLLNANGVSAAGEFTPLEAEMLLRLPHTSDPVTTVKFARQDLASGYWPLLTQWLPWALLFGGLTCYNGLHATPDLLPWLPSVLCSSLLGMLLTRYERLQVLRLVEQELPRSSLLEQLVEDSSAFATPGRAALWQTDRAVKLGIGLAERVRLAARQLDHLLERSPRRMQLWWLAPLRGSLLLGGLALTAWYFDLHVPNLMGALALALFALVSPPSKAGYSLRAYFADALVLALLDRVAERLGRTSALAKPAPWSRAALPVQRLTSPFATEQL